MTRNPSPNPLEDPFKRVAELVFEIERSEQLLQHGLWPRSTRVVWEASRVRLGALLRKELLKSTVVDGGSVSAQRYRRTPLRTVLGFARDVIRRNPLSAPARRPVLIWAHERKLIRHEGCYEDIYTAPVLDIVGTGNAFVITPPFRGEYTGGSKLCRFAYSGGLLLAIARLLKTFVKLRRFRRVERLAQRVQPYISRAFPDGDVSISAFLKDRAADLATKTAVFRLLLKRLKPRLLVIANAYGFPGLVLAAKTLSIPIVEMQHGTITNDHLGYAVPAQSSRLIYPDKLYVFGDYWRQSVTFPSNNFEAVPIGFPYFDAQRSTLSNVPKENLLVFLSQPTIRSSMEELAVRIVPALDENIRVLFKMHPAETSELAIGGAQKEQLQAIIEQGRIVFVKNEIEIHELLARARWVVGAYSTSVFEAVGYGCRALLANAPGVSMMQPLVEYGYATMLDQEHMEATLAWTPVPSSSELLFASDAVSRLSKALSLQLSILIEWAPLKTRQNVAGDGGVG